MRLPFLFCLATFCLFSLNSCVHYQRYRMAETRLQRINPEIISIYLIDAAHPLTRGWYLAEPKFEENHVRGFLTRMAEVETLEITQLSSRTDAQQSRNDVLLYLKPRFANSLPDTTIMDIPHVQIERIEVCELNTMKTLGLPLLGCAGVVFLSLLFTGN